MPVHLPITTYGMGILRKKAEPVNKIDTNIIELVDNMFYTMDNAEGVGLAAPQVNHAISLCIIDISFIDKYKHIKPVALINPVILESHGEATDDEGCLSIPTIRGAVTRPEKIYIKYHDFNMKEVFLETDDLQARVIQHEMDHLNGVLFVDKLDPDELKKLKSQLNKVKKQKVETDYPLFSLINEIK